MKMNRKPITLKDGREIEKITLSNTQGMKVEVLTLGGIIKSIQLADREGKLENILLEYQDINDYIKNVGYINALIGRTAGRIDQGRFTLNGQSYQVNSNQGKHTLHGGIEGFDKKIWQAKDVSKENISAVELSYRSEDGEEGYPGNLEVKVTYTLYNDNTLDILYKAICDQDTLVNLTNHSYFNLSGNAKRPILDHKLLIQSNGLCELDKDSIPTGKILTLADHPPFDFRELKAIGQDMNQNHIQLNRMGGYDHPWVLEGGTQSIILYDPLSGRQLEISTDQEVVVVYTMNAKNPSQFTNGKANIKHYGIAFETQGFPVGHDECFKERNILLKNDTYTHRTKWKFTTY